MFQLAVQPDAGVAPMPLDGDRRHAEGFDGHAVAGKQTACRNRNRSPRFCRGTELPGDASAGSRRKATEKKEGTESNHQTDCCWDAVRPPSRCSVSSATSVAPSRPGDRHLGLRRGVRRRECLLVVNKRGQSRGLRLMAAGVHQRRPATVRSVGGIARFGGRFRDPNSFYRPIKRCSRTARLDGLGQAA